MFATDPQTLLFGIAKDGVQGWKIQVGKDLPSVTRRPARALKANHGWPGRPCRPLLPLKGSYISWRKCEQLNQSGL